MRTVSDLYLLAVKMACVAHAVKDYDGEPYFVHYDEVEDILREYGFGDNETLIIAARLHDIIEDCGWTYNDVKKLFGVDVAELVYLVTDFKGRNRNERKPDELYIEMRKKVFAITLKLADRLANARRSCANRHGMGGKYKEEYVHFKEMLHNEEHRMLAPMWRELEGLMECIC
jgi:(p)ppGpp synthase/HD superfamily hydrolase